MAKTGGAEYYSVTSFALTLYIFCSHTIVLRPSRFGHGAFCVLADIFFPNDERSRQKMSRQKSARSFCPAFKVTAINRRMCSGQPHTESRNSHLWERTNRPRGLGAADFNRLVVVLPCGLHPIAR